MYYFITFGSIAITIFSEVRHLKFPSEIRHSGQIFTWLLHSLQSMWPLSHRNIGVDVGGARHTGHSKIFFSPSMDITVSLSSSNMGKAAAILIILILLDTNCALLIV